MDQDSGRIIYSKNMNEQKLIASTTKIMTAVLAIESNKLDSIVTVDDSILKAYGSAIYIQVGEEITLRDLVYGLMLRSGNDAAIAIATYVSGNLNDFVTKMNEKAKEIGMSNSIFVNPHGLDSGGGNLSTCYDMAILTRYADSLDEYRKIVGTKKYTAKSNYKTYVWTNKNKLLTSYKYTTGGKTGFTEKARRTLVTTASKNNMNLIVVTLNDPNDWNTHKEAYEYAFNSYHRYRILNRDNFYVDSDYYKNELYIKHNYYYPLEEAETKDISVKVALDKLTSYKNKTKVGIVSVYFKSSLIYKEDVYIKVNKVNNQSNIFIKLWKWFAS